jgi:hypothetical protein
VFVVEDRHGALVLLEHPDHFLEELEAWVENLPFGVPRIITVFANDHDSIHRQLVAPAPQRFGDGGINGKVMIGGALAAEISGGLLIHVKRDDSQWRPVP